MSLSGDKTNFIILMHYPMVSLCFEDTSVRGRSSRIVAEVVVHKKGIPLSISIEQYCIARNRLVGGNSRSKGSITATRVINH